MSEYLEAFRRLSGGGTPVPIVPIVPIAPEPPPIGTFGTFGTTLRSPQAEALPTAVENWRAHYEERAAIRQYLGGYDCTTAERLAYGELLTDWHREHGAKPDPARCAGCGGALAGHPAHAFPDGAGVHTDGDLECWNAYGKRWRAAAADGLAQLGIARPEGFDL